MLGWLEFVARVLRAVLSGIEAFLGETADDETLAGG